MKIKTRKKNDRYAFFNNTPDQYRNWRSSYRAFDQTARELADQHVKNQIMGERRAEMLRQ
jgi:hypothetical protein